MFNRPYLLLDKTFILIVTVVFEGQKFLSFSPCRRRRVTVAVLLGTVVVRYYLCRYRRF